MKGRNILLIAVIAITISASTFSFYAYQVLYSPNILIDKEPQFIHIPTGSDFSDVQKILSESDYINDLMAFSLLSKLMKYDRLVKPGRYLLQKDMNNRAAIRLLRSGEQSPVRITFNNIRLTEELPDKICSDLEIDPEELRLFLEDSAVSARYGFNRQNFLGMFIPNTYEVYWNISKEQFLDRMKKEYDSFWNAERMDLSRKIGLTPMEVNTLASIVKAECFHKEEAPVIAGLYINRININMPLQADPTIVFANRDYSIHRVLEKHKEIDSPYNTYRYAGLPPGPINMPEIVYIDAVLNFEKHNYIYMCAREDFSDYHNFTSSYTEHLRNARSYAAALNREKIFR
ncbi:MAG TPA: endolytic transglycosylase MltG [Cyclobacteriaceae bacterium]|nr:endolytic transglycosylase MltG [Cyclobacteriaceae bacterium]